jgi:Protein of unknown function (DUF2958)
MNTHTDALTALDRKVANMQTRARETQRRLRGHNFYAPKSVKVPALRAQDGLGLDAVVAIHYFASNMDWYVTEYDPATGEAFGFVLNGSTGEGELGYFSLPELEALRAGFFVVERDLYWDRQTIRQAVAR